MSTTENERVVVVGAGDVGTNIATDLADGYDLTVVDGDADRVEALSSSLPVTAVHGDGRSLATLREAGIEDADIVVASTDSDEVNVMICGAVNHLADGAFTIARVKDADLYRTWQRFDDAFGVNLMLCVDLLTAETIVRTATLPGVQAAKTFADGQIELAEFVVGADDPIAGKSVEEADTIPELTYGGVVRDGDVIIPGGETVIREGDRVIVIGSRGAVAQFSRRLSPTLAVDAGDDVIVLGGGEIGVQTARLFEEQGFSPRLIERDAERAADVEERLSDTEVVAGDAASADFLVEQRIPDADLVVSALDESTNYLVSLLARRLGDAQTIAVVEDRDHVDLFETAGVASAIQPRTVVGQEITRIVRGGFAEDITFIEDDRAEVFEFTVDSDSVLTGAPIRTVVEKLPDGFVVGALIRNGQAVSARGGTVIETGDRLVAFVDADVRDEIVPRL